MRKEDWFERVVERSDMSSRLIHLTKGKTNDEAFENLWSILIDKKIKATYAKRNNRKTVYGKTPVVCFMDAPLINVAENLRIEEKCFDKVEGTDRRYAAFGIRMLKSEIFNRGGRPVIYEKFTRKNEAVEEFGEKIWRIVTIDYAKDKIIDWTHEREWRMKKDVEFKYDQIEVIVRSPKYYKLLVNRCIDQNRLDILKNVKGIVALNTVCS